RAGPRDPAGCRRNDREGDPRSQSRRARRRPHFQCRAAASLHEGRARFPQVTRSCTMDERERYDRGMAQRRKVLGNAWVDRANAKKSPFTEEFQDFITRAAWGEVWTRPHYDERTRRILVI